MAFNLVCRHCNVPHYRNHQANTNGGGVGRWFRWEGDLCPVCIQSFSEVSV